MLHKRLIKRLQRIEQELKRRRPEILLGVQIPQPLWGTSPRVVLGRKWWDAVRKAAYLAAKFHCVACGTWKMASVGRILEGHEIYEVDWFLRRMHYVETVALCCFCHKYAHKGRTKALMEAGALSPLKYAAIMRHGDAILASAGISRNREQYVRNVGWTDWRLVVCGKEYPPVYDSAESMSLEQRESPEWR